MTEPVKVGVIGLGLGRAHVTAFLKKQDAIEVVAVSDLNEQRMDEAARTCTDAGAPAPRRFTDYRDMLELDPLDIVVIATPNFLHAPMAVDCLRAGKHALVEKPPSDTVEGARRILDAVRETGNRCMIGLTYRFRSGVERLKQLIVGGEFGDLYFAKTGWTRPRAIPTGSDGWFLDKKRAGGGPLIDLGVHLFDMTWWLMGCPKPHSVTGTTYDPFLRNLKDTHASVEDLAAGFVRFANGAAVFVEASWASHTEASRMYSHLLGTKAGATIDFLAVGDRRAIRVHTEREGEHDEITYPEFEHIVWDPGFIDQLLYFAQCIREGRPNMADAAEGLQLMQIICGLYESARTGNEVLLGT